MLYKVLNEDGSPYYGGIGVWPLPRRNDDGTWTPGEWIKVAGEVVPCRNGLHLCRENDLLEWLGPAIYEAEHKGELVETGGKVVVRQARLLRRLRWDERTARLFACDCAEHVLHLYERAYPGDQRPCQAIEVARRYADGEASTDELAAARAAAVTAAEAAARAARGATWAAAGAARAARAAVGAAEAAAWAAEAARAAAGVAGAAWAARAAWAAGAAAEAAEAAAWAAEAAAWVAEREWQMQRLMSYLSEQERNGT